MTNIFKKLRARESLFAHYASPSEFRQLFAESRDELLCLARFLTGQEQLAEACIVDACALSLGENPVFEEWLESWARRATIRCALEMQRAQIAGLRPAYEKHRCPHGKHAPLDLDLVEKLCQEPGMVRQLDALCRFALVLRGIDNYPLQECGTMLGVSIAAVEAAYCAALQHIQALADNVRLGEGSANA